MAYHTIADIFAMIEQAQARFVASAGNLTAAQEDFRAADDQWTIAEIAEHVGIVNSGFLRLTHKLLGQAEAKGVPAPADLNLGHTALDENGDQLPPFQAPERVRPQGGAPVAASLAKMQETLQGLTELSPRLAAVDCAQEKFPHPALGPLSLYQWLVLYGEHEERHRGQIERVKAALGYPV